MIKILNELKNITYVLLVLSALLITSSPVQAAVAPDLGATANFVILGGTTVTNTGASTIFGDVGVSPGTSIIGFPPSTANMVIHPGDAVAAQAQSDLTIAFTNVSAQAPTADLTGQELGGRILTPGVYRFSTTASLTNGILTLNAQNNRDAVFIFQIGTTLTTSGNADVQLDGGARATNVFWQVGDSATLSSTGSFRGTILAQNSITLNNLAAIEGRALARNGAVTLNNNLVRVPQIIRLVNLAPFAVPNGTDKLPMSVTVTEFDPNVNEVIPIVNEGVILSSNRTQDAFVDVAPVNLVTTDAAGQALFNITSTLPGVAKITATTGKATVSTNVLFRAATQLLTAITISPPAPTVLAGSITNFTATALDQFGAPIVPTPAVIWNSSNTTVGTIDVAGVFTASAPGTTVITAANGTVVGNTTVTVTAGQPLLTTITVSPAAITVPPGNITSFTANAFDQFGAPIVPAPAVIWNSNNTTVGTIDAAGVFTASAPGTTVITAANGTISGNATVTVTAAPVLTTITVIPAAATVAVNRVINFTAAILDQFGAVFPATVTWTSSNIAVGTITESGAFTALSPGATIITATNGTVSGNATARVSNLSIVVLPFDTNGNDRIDRPEAVDAVVRFFNGDLAVPRPTAVAVVVAFFQV